MFTLIFVTSSYIIANRPPYGKLAARWVAVIWRGYFWGYSASPAAGNPAFMRLGEDDVKDALPPA
jgi:hypothetical protein